jgi:general secretion pathway protein N
MMQINSVIYFMNRHKRSLSIIVFAIFFICNFIYKAPTSILSHMVASYSKQQLQLVNTTGTFWKGSGLVIINSSKKNNPSTTPLLELNWKISFGTSHFIKALFSIGKSQIANIYLDSKGLNIDNLTLSLSIRQASHFMDVVNDLGISGNLMISSSHILLDKKASGNVLLTLDNISSSLSPVNPLGSYQAQVNLGDNAVTITTPNTSDAALILDGSGSINGLSIKATPAPSKKQQMLQFLTLMGIPQPDGSYMLKLM